jgi:lysophospholipase L1-like esterase
MWRTSLLLAGLVAWAGVGLPPTAQVSSPARVAAGQRVAFLGDSITQFGADHPAGYVRLIEAAFKDQGRAIVVIPAGVSGNTSQDMLSRLQRDVLDKKPDWMLLSCGVNDVWHGAQGVPLDRYKENITSMVDQAMAAKIHVVILTSTMITEDQAGAFNQQLIPYNEFLHDLAKQRGLPLADLNADMQAAVEQARKETGMTGNLLTGTTLSPHANISLRQYLQLRAVAAKQGLTPEAMLDQMFNQDVQNLLVNPGSAPKKSP